MWISPREYRIIGRRLEALRKAEGVSQAELAKRLSKPQSFVSAYESGQRRVDLLELKRIADGLGIDARAFFEALLDVIAPASGKKKKRAR